MKIFTNKYQIPLAPFLAVKKNFLAALTFNQVYKTLTNFIRQIDLKKENL